MKSNSVILWVLIGAAAAYTANMITATQSGAVEPNPLGRYLMPLLAVAPAVGLWRYGVACGVAAAAGEFAYVSFGLSHSL